MLHGPDKPEAGNKPEIEDGPRAPSRRAALLMLAGGLALAGAPLEAEPEAEEASPVADIVIFDGWVLRRDDVEGLLSGAG